MQSPIFKCSGNCLVFTQNNKRKVTKCHSHDKITLYAKVDGMPFYRLHCFVRLSSTLTRDALLLVSQRETSML